jgi:hypothetical protein
MILGIVVLYAVIDFAQPFHSGYIDGVTCRHRWCLHSDIRRRHRLIARGFARWRCAKSRRRHGSRRAGCDRLAGGLGQTLRPEKSEARAERAVAGGCVRTRWSRRRGGTEEPPRLCATSGRGALPGAAAGTARRLRQGARYLIVDDDDLDSFRSSVTRGRAVAPHCVRVKSRWARCGFAERTSPATDVAADLECAVALGPAATHASGTN